MIKILLLSGACYALMSLVEWALHGWAWGPIHREMHFPEGRWFSGLRLFRFWRSYHKTHHDHPGRNFNVLCPGADWLFGTYKSPT
jgi:hypothetical protein